MKIATTEKNNDITILYIDLDRATYKESIEFRKTLNELIKKGEKKLLIDLSKCEFMDSTFLSVLVTSLKKINDEGGDMKLLNIHPSLQSLIELTGTSKIFEIYTSKEEAIKSF